jgi:phenylglyoxylate dehydrogenase gamma subunit
VPSFGFERRGAPVAAFLRMDTREIRRMTNIYEPDCVVCIDPTVSRTVNIFEGVRSNATLVLTTRHPLAELELPPAIRTVGLCDAVTIALEVFKKTITNTIMLGAFARTTGLVSLGSLRRALEESEFRDAGLAQNLRALQLGYDSTSVHQLGERVAA